MVYQLVHDGAPGTVVVLALDEHAAVTGTVEVAAEHLPRLVAERERDRPRWVWDDTRHRYPSLLAAGVRVERCHDLRLCHTILRGSTFAAASELATAPDGPWDAPRSVELPAGPAPEAGTLFEDLEDMAEPEETEDEPAVASVRHGDADGAGSPAPGDASLLELRRQLDAVAGSLHPGRLRLLLAAESTGALIAQEMRHDGLPWDAATHDAILTAALGPRPLPGGRPQRMEDLAGQIRAALHLPGLNPDSPADVLRGLRLAGFELTTTSKWEIQALDHPVREPLLEYKRLHRLFTANGWSWCDQWVHDGRFRPEFVPGGVVSGRWATSGGGALQLPALVRGAVRADPGWRLVVADAAQLEPRVLAAMSRDTAMAAAGRHADLYAGVVDAGIVANRSEAKYAMLGAIYGATTGASGALMPQLTRAYPQAVALVEEAARAGERGEAVTTWLGRSSPRPDASWRAMRSAVSGEGASAEDVRAARRRARDWGRFTRNFVVQGTAAEWALCWLAALRRTLHGLPGGAHLVFFLHDEVVVHAPADVAEAAADAVRAAAAEAGRLLFGTFPVDFALDVSVVDSYDQAA